MEVNEQLPEGAEKAKAVQNMFDTIAPRYDALNRILTLRLDVGWRRRTIKELHLEPGARVLDLATGTGDFCRELDRGGYSNVGMDFSYGMLASARTDAPLVQADALALPVATASFDGITCGFALRNFTELQPFFAECARVLRPGGRLCLLEVAEPNNRVVRAGHQFYFNKVVPKIGGLISDKGAYAYLPRSVAYLPEGDGLTNMITEAGFDDARRTMLSGGISQLLTATRSR
jgi:demethylmenaquinone methyltransferase/2-methoxy-6-polyprenyl-1,4-benzoquinol methylase